MPSGFVLAIPVRSEFRQIGHWGLTAPNSKEVRFTHHNDLKKFYETAKEVGVLVVLRPG
jgi:beta-galactosidase GanA